MPVPCTIPDPGGPLLCGTVFCGQAITGQPRPADTYADFTLDLPSGTAELVISTAISLALVLDADGPTLALGVVITVTDSQVLGLAGDVGGQLVHGVSLVTTTGDLNLDADPPTFQIGTVTALPDSMPLELDGDEGVIVNPILLLFDCEPLDLDDLTCTPLDLDDLDVTEVEPEPVLCEGPA